jgi:hypothetical protein
MLSVLDVLLLTTLLAGGMPDCTCASDMPPISDRLRSAQWVFLGKATERQAVTQTPVGSTQRRHGRYYPVIVLQTWKDERPGYAAGRQPAVMTFDDCRASFTLDKRYVFFADRYGTISRCAPPAPSDEAGDLVRQLDAEMQRLNGSTVPK